MKRTLLALVMVIICCGQVLAGGGLDGFLNSLNVQANADLNGFSARVGVQFGVPVVRVEEVIHSVRTPADAFMVFQLGQMTSRPPATVLSVYKAHRGRGWGVIAKELGIKPGSREFHALKRGDFVLAGGPEAVPGKGHGGGHGKGKGKGHNK